MDINIDDIEEMSDTSSIEIFQSVTGPRLDTATIISHTVMDSYWSITSAHFTNYNTYEELITYSDFTSQLHNAYEYINYHLPANRQLICIRFKFKVKDQHGLLDDYEDNFRINMDEFLQSDFYRKLDHYMRGNEGWKYTNIEKDINSDHVTGKFVMYDVSRVEFIDEPIIQATEVTLLSGHKRLHKNYFIKHIDSSHHKDCLNNRIVYLDGDCFFELCNELSEIKYHPKELRKMLWPTIQDNELYNCQVYSSRCYKQISQIYKMTFIIHNLDKNKIVRVTANANYPVVELYKLGSVIGIKDIQTTGFEEDQDISDETNNNISKYLFYDLETIQDKKLAKFYPYSFSFIINGGLTQTSKASDVLTIADHDVNYVEKKLVEYLILLLSTKGSPIIYYTYAWNGSRFDHRILMSLLKDNSFKISNILTNGAREVLSTHITYQKSKNKIILRDPCKIFPGSLNTIAELFGFPLKDEFNHDKVEKEFMNKETWPTYFESIKGKVLEYNTHDTRLVERITIKLKELLETSITVNNVCIKLNFNSLVSRSMAARKIWKSSLSTDLLSYIYPSKENKERGDPYLPCNPYYNIKINNHTYLLDTILSQAVVGGRTQTPYGKQHFIDAVQIDARSMYPSQAVLKRYPYGQYHPTNKFVPSKLGIYLIEIISQRHPTVLPLRVKGKPLNWSYTGSMTTWTSNVSIEMLHELGYEYKVLHGFYFEDSTDQYFKAYMNYFYNARLRYKEQKQNIYAEDCKIKLNALTGSLLQDNFKTFIKIMTEQEHIEFYKKYHKVVAINDITEIDTNKYYITFRPLKLGVHQQGLQEIQKEACTNAITENPNLLTVFILEYSRTELLKIWKKIENPSMNCYMVMCDTDSLLFTNRSYALQRMEELDITGTDMGQWGFDFHNVIDGYVIRPKCYGLRGYKDIVTDLVNTPMIDKIRVKGVTDRSLVSTSTDQKLFIPFKDNYSQDFNVRSNDYMEIIKKIPNVDGIINDEDKKKYLGPKFEHIRSAYNGEFVQVLHFQMRKGFYGVSKKYVVMNLTKEEENYYDDNDDVVNDNVDDYSVVNV